MFGTNIYVQCGTMDRNFATTPLEIESLTNVIQVSCGSTHTGVVTGDGKLYMFGHNNFGQLGYPTPGRSTSTPREVTSIPDVVQVSCGSEYTAVVTRNGELYTFGRNVNGRLGYGTLDHSGVPVKVESLTDIVQVNCGEYHTGALTSSGRLYMFGDNRYGQLGIEGEDRFIEPVELLLPYNIVQVSCGGFHTGVIDTSGNVYLFGSDMSGQLGNGVPIHSAAMISCGSIHTGVIGHVDEM
jgi:alpha-tubulin suppressor-like RCC1 family protein